jgi:hypothetical protein
MKLSIIALAGGILLAGTFAARARIHRHHHQARPGIAPDTRDTSGANPETTLPRLPNFFKNCEHPAPWFCRDL